MTSFKLHTQKGAMLLEALIGILIFSTGILAVIGLQAASVRTAGDTKYRADASFFASQIVANMRADSAANWPTYSLNPVVLGTQPPCAPGGVANANVNAWLLELAAALPRAMASISVVAPNPFVNNVQVTVCWQAAQDSTQHRHTVNTTISRNPPP